MSLNPLSSSSVGLLAEQQEFRRSCAMNFALRSTPEQIGSWSGRTALERDHRPWGLRNVSGLQQSWDWSDDSQGLPESQEVRGILKVFIDTCQRWGLDQDEQVILLGYRSGDIAGRGVLDGSVRAHSRDVIDRAAYVVAISLGLGILYGEKVPPELRWLRSPRKVLDGKAPLERMLEGGMIDLITVNEMVNQERGL